MKINQLRDMNISTLNRLKKEELVDIIKELNCRWRNMTPTFAGDMEYRIEHYKKITNTTIFNKTGKFLDSVDKLISILSLNGDTIQIKDDLKVIVDFNKWNDFFDKFSNIVKEARIERDLMLANIDLLDDAINEEVEIWW